MCSRRDNNNKGRDNNNKEMKRLRIFAIFTLLLLCRANNAASQVVVNVSMDTTRILIGEQVLMKVRVSAAGNDLIVMPEFPDSVLVEGVEVLSHYTEKSGPIDQGRRQAITEAYRITSFDSAVYYIPPIEVRVGDSVYKSKRGIALEVISPQVDTTHIDKFFGPKDIASVYYDWDDLRMPMGLWAMGVVLLLLALYMAIQIKNNHRILPNIRLRLEGPPHKWAMRQIAKLRNTRPHNPDEAHRYYAGLTDIVRTYIARRYGFKATAMTSAQIIEHLKGANDPHLLQELQEMFEAADLVKYAGLNQQVDENDRNLLIAMEYVNATKDPGDEKKQIKPKEAATVKRSRMRRDILLAANIVLALVGAGIVARAVWMVYNMYY